ncbi:F-box protein [Trifolium medium]|uniref:F-box protein n=1 Tax=Trifolium medium TaxID=97028 RepID=A0A392PP65_9FABA|nr:F-box protein [Trifolium medium]
MAPTFEKKVSSSYIPDDIVSSILSKLSVKSLNRFSCACKSWSLLFQNPNFFKMFRKNIVSKSHDDDDTCLLFNWLSGPVKLSFLSGDKFEKEVKLDPPTPFHIQKYQHRFSPISILGSSVNGTLCIHDSGDHTRVVLWNPATDKVNVIPPSLLEFPTYVTSDFSSSWIWL